MVRVAKGLKEQEMHRQGKRLSARQALYAKCADCMGWYADGRQDCEMPDCSLYPFMPYNKNKIKVREGNPLSNPYLNALNAKKKRGAL